MGLGVGVGVCLGSICLAVCQYSGVSEFVLTGKTGSLCSLVGLQALTGVGLGVCLCLGSICLAVCQYSGVSEFVLTGKTRSLCSLVGLQDPLSRTLSSFISSYKTVYLIIIINFML